MPVPANLQAKYLYLGPANPWPSIPGTRFLSGLMADIDGDGCDEVIALSPACLGLTQAALGILSYFDYSALSDSLQAGPPQLLATGSMALGSGQTVTPVTLRGAGLVDLMVFDPAGQGLTLFSWTDGALAAIWTTGPNISGSTSWALEPGNSFFLGDIDGDGVQEIIALSNSTDAASSAPATIAVFKWVEGSGIQVIWTAPDGLIPNGGGGTWNVYSADIFRVGDLEGHELPQILAYDGNSWLGVLSWNAGSQQLEVGWMTEGSVASQTEGVDAWPIGNADWYHLADIDGDGIDELVCSNAGQLGALKWDGSALAAIGNNAGQIPAAGDGGTWVIGAQDIHHVGYIQSPAAASIVVYDPADAWLGVLSWDGAANSYVADWLSNGTISANGQSWTIGGDNILARADVDGDGILEIVVQSDGSSALGYLKWIGGALSPVWVYSTQAAGSAPLQGWGVGIIANAPATKFSWPSQAQQDIYNQTCLSLTQYGYPTNDLRSLYWNSQIGTDLGDFASDLVSALSGLSQKTPVYYWDWMTTPTPYAMSDLVAVLTILTAEFQAIPAIWTFDANMDLFLKSLLTQQQTDLQTVQANLTATPPGSDTGSYWVGQILDAAIWAAAATPLGMAGQVVLAAGASLFGSAINQVNISPEQAAYDDIAKLLTANCQTATDTIDAMISNHQAGTGIVTDQLKIPVIGRYVIGFAGWNSNDTDKIAANSTNYNRTIFYQQLMSQIYQVNVYDVIDPSLNFLSPPLGALPAYASQASTYPTGTTIQVIMQPEWGRGNQPLFPTKGLMNDLQSLGFSLSDMLNGAPPMNLAQVNGVNNAGDQGCYLYATNQTDVPVRFSVAGSAQTASPGQTVLFSNQIWWDTGYKMSGELEDGSASGNKTEVRIDPSNGRSGSDFSGYAVAILKGSDNCYFNHLN